VLSINCQSRHSHSCRLDADSDCIACVSDLDDRQGPSVEAADVSPRLPPLSRRYTDVPSPRVIARLTEKWREDMIFDDLVRGIILHHHTHGVCILPDSTRSILND